MKDTKCSNSVGTERDQVQFVCESECSNLVPIYSCLQTDKNPPTVALPASIYTPRQNCRSARAGNRITRTLPVSSSR